MEEAEINVPLVMVSIWGQRAAVKTNPLRERGEPYQNGLGGLPFYYVFFRGKDLPFRPVQRSPFLAANIIRNSKHWKHASNARGPGESRNARK